MRKGRRTGGKIEVYKENGTLPGTGQKIETEEMRGQCVLGRRNRLICFLGTIPRSFHLASFHYWNARGFAHDSVVLKAGLQTLLSRSGLTSLSLPSSLALSWPAI